MRTSLGAALVFASFVSSASAETSIWFKPATWSVDAGGSKLDYDHHDFPRLLADDAAWSRTAANIEVFVLPGNVVWSYPDLPGLVAFIERHHFKKVALVAGVLFDGGTCATPREAITRDQTENEETVKFTAQWKSVGGRLDYIIMDTPLYAAHYFVPDCNMTIDEIARRAGATVAGVRKSFPDAQYVDADGPGFVDERQWLDDMVAFFDAFKAVTGSPVASVAGDFHWVEIRPGMTWQQVVRDCVATFGPLGIPTGIIVNAEPTAGMSKREWRDLVREHALAAVHSDLGLAYLDFDEWQSMIDNNLPETDPASWTSAVLDAVDARARGRGVTPP